MPTLDEICIYHILHVSRLPSVLNDGYLGPDAQMATRCASGPTIGLSDIKQRRLNFNRLSSRPGLYVGQCVPFYFCPGSIMLYVIHRGNHEGLIYRDGQRRIVHSEARLKSTIDWVDRSALRWALRFSNAGANYFEDDCQTSDLGKVNWAAVQSRYRADPEVRGPKQAAFLPEQAFPVALVERIGVDGSETKKKLEDCYTTKPQPPVILCPGWYY